MSKAKTLKRRADLIFANPFYAININPVFFTENDVTVRSKEHWISTNAKLIEEMGRRKWLRLLLEALEGKYLNK